MRLRLRWRAKVKMVVGKMKKMSFVLFIYLLIAPCIVVAGYPNFDGNPLFTSHMRKRMKPFLLPLNHPLKVKLDAIFSRSRVIANEESFVAAGFETLSIRPVSYVRLAKHPKIPGYLFKLFLDTELRQKDEKPGWHWLANRCEGARNVRNLIKKKKLKHFAVPDKWLYPLSYSKSIQGSKQPVILIVEDMNLTSHQESCEAWHNLVTRECVEELYCILSHGYSSCFLVENIPYSKRKKFACIDTEHPKRNMRKRYPKVGEYLSPEMGAYWKKLTRGSNKK